MPIFTSCNGYYRDIHKDTATILLVLYNTMLFVVAPLHLIANNVRFLILPWVKIKHLASRVLSLALRRLSDDWNTVYGHPVYLAETFVDTARFKGTCYQAANWIRAGKTKGSAKRGNRYLYHDQPKDLYLYPLQKNFRRFPGCDQG
ncbi:hypothetical protein KsCSTR_39990 [Candidatus Kuenenia stuttgartiensis]|uniref:Uncharacterized protein n=1 Tax=Kuenenia stuttgartiensis TaxID=174633 RepID=A0A6G7GUW2_KUEST|nr:Druantia anti-phage system protein DruA [Candidatus Kuenenia stuttgartiensis]QII13378.1 hypothetical protein KsCSTR_39990 [Candidatus Kuenenia stuttgartiensis]